MNNLVYTLLLLAASALCWLGGHATVRSNTARNSSLAGQLAELEETGRQDRQALDLLRSEVEQQRQELRETRLVMEAPSASRATDVAAGGAVSGEDVWPAGKPYFYIAKKHLPGVDFNPFMRFATSITNLGRLQPAAAALLGMSPEEQAAINQASKTFSDGIIELQRTRAERVPAAPGVNTKDHQEVTYKIPVLTNEMDRLEGGFTNSVQAVLGATRAALFLPKALEWFDSAWRTRAVAYETQTSAKPFLISYSADRRAGGRVDHSLKFATAENKLMAVQSFTILSEVDNPALQYRHLFGDQPLLGPEQK